MSVSKTAKIADSLPAIHIKQAGRKTSSSLRIFSHSKKNDGENGSSKNLLKIEPDTANEMAQSMPMLTIGGPENKQNNLIKPTVGGKMQSINSALDIMAHIRSLQTIPIYNINGQDDESEEEEENEAVVVAEADQEGRMKQRIDRCMNIKFKLGQLTSEVDVSLFKNTVFIFFAISNFLTSLGFNTPFIYIVDQATILNIETRKADLLLSTIGISNTIGRVILGFISDIKNINRLFLYAALLTLCGIFTVIEPFLTTFGGLFVYAALFGITSGMKLISIYV